MDRHHSKYGTHHICGADAIVSSHREALLIICSRRCFSTLAHVSLDLLLSPTEAGLSFCVLEVVLSEKINGILMEMVSGSDTSQEAETWVELSVPAWK